MNEQTRYRITGSLFIIALAIIFLPMLFDGAGVQDLKLPVEQVAPGNGFKIPPKSISASSFAKAESLESRIKQRQKKAQIGEAVILPVPPTSNDVNSVSSWGVQLGSFTSEENAKKLKMQLEKARHNVVLSRANDSGEIITRVAIGPLVRESDAIKLRQQLSLSYQEAIVVKLGY